MAQASSTTIDLGPAQLWGSPDGRLSIQSQMANGSSAIDMWPNAGELPVVNSITELTLYRTPWTSTNMERFNVSAMVDGENNGAYRFGVERSGGGQFRDIIFCFENVTPGVAFCPFKITTSGVYVSHDGVNYNQL